MLMPGRKYSSGKYRYGFNGKRMDNEIKGIGNSYDYGARIYDPRIVRWLSSDPAITEYPSYSPYNFALNNPIINLDNDGKRVYYCPGLGGRGANPDGTMSTTGGSKYVQSVADAFTGSGVYFKELQGVNGNPGSSNIGKGNNPRLTDAMFVAKYGQKPVQSLNTDHRIANAVTQIVQDATQHPLNPGEKVNLIGTSMGAVTTAQTALYILEHKKELGLPDDFRIDNVILAGSTVNTKSRLYKRLEKALQNQAGGAGRLLSGTVDENGENGYNYPEDQDGVTGLAGRTKFGMIGRFFRLIKQVVRIGKNGKLISVNEDHPHLKAADDPNFGKGLIKQALEKDKIEGDKGAEGAKEYLKPSGG